jgi:hypothetical protein
MFMMGVIAMSLGVLALLPSVAVGATDAAFDWENPPANASADPYALPTFKSTRTLGETTKWLKAALERYGSVKPTIYQNEIKDVRFLDCTMEWTHRGDLGSGLSRVTSYSVPLGDVDLTVHAVQIFTDEMRFRTTRPFPVVEKILDKSTQKSTATRKESSAQILLRRESQMPSRVAWALVHAARLCGARVPAPR